MMNETKKYILPDDVCYTCGEDEEYCDCEEGEGGFDSTLARERDNVWNEAWWPRSVADVRQAIADEMGFNSYEDMLASIGIYIEE